MATLGLGAACTGGGAPGADGGDANDAGPRVDGGNPGGDAGHPGSDGGFRADGGTDGGSGGTTDGGSGAPDGGCLAGPLLQSVNKDHLLIGASMENTTAGQAPFDLRYLYLAGGLFDGASPCASCASGCSAGGQSCAGGACGWWGCWQWDQLPPGQYASDFINRTKGNAQIPMFTYYELLHASGVQEGAPEVTAANDVNLMRRYFADWRFLLRKIGTQTAFLHLEPDFWGYAQHVNSNPHLIPAAVASANPTDCSGFANTIAGMGRCLVSMVRTYAPNAKVGLHASAWGSKIDVYLNRDPAFDVAAEARKVATFLKECGAADGDFVVVETSDRDAGYYTSIGQNRWWDATNATLPNFRQALAWAKALAESVGKPLLWWQMPVGNMNLPNVSGQWRDNRLDYFFDHLDEVAGTHSAGVAFGAGAGGQTTPESDNGHLLSRVRATAAAGGQPVCR
ncbi:MAG TPA: hypothetical protein VK420_12990 [Longimicrobium sp.]|nr:hypothetical protein [Longimicrobium sp.]